MFLLQSIAEEEEKQLVHMISVLGVVNTLFKTAIRHAYPNIPVQPAVVQALANLKFGDYKCIAPMPLSKVPLSIVSVAGIILTL